MYALQNSSSHLGRFALQTRYGPYAVYGGNFLSWLRRTGKRLYDVIKLSIKKAAPSVVHAIIGDKDARESLKNVGKETLQNIGRESQVILREESKRIASNIADKIRARLNR